MSVGRDHSHAIRTQLPEHAVQDRPAFFGGRGERGMRYEPVQIARADSPGILELDRRKAGELIAWQAEESEPRASAFDGNSLFSGCADLDRCRGQLASDLGQLFRWNRNRALLLDIRADLGAHSDIQIGTSEPNTLLGSLDQNVRQNRERSLRGNAGSDSGETFLQFFTRDRESHSGSSGSQQSRSYLVLFILKYR